MPKLKRPTFAEFKRDQKLNPHIPPSFWMRLLERRKEHVDVIRKINQLNLEEKMIISEVVGEISPATVEEFLKMHPGKREVLMARVLARKIREGKIEEFIILRDARNQLYEKHISWPTRKHKIEAEEEFTEYQQELAEKGNFRKIEQFWEKVRANTIEWDRDNLWGLANAIRMLIYNGELVQVLKEKIGDISPEKWIQRYKEKHAGSAIIDRLILEENISTQEILEALAQYVEYEALRRLSGDIDVIDMVEFEPPSINIPKKEISEDEVLYIEYRINNQRYVLLGVFDGVSSTHNSARVSKKTRQILEAFAIVGLIRTPQDVYAALVLADLYAYGKGSATTAAVALIHNNDFYGIHAGDSKWRVFRKSKNWRIIYESRDHTWAEVTKNRRMKHMLLSSIGGNLTIEINNEDDLPVLLTDEDIILLESDGFTDVICKHEHEQLMNQCKGDEQKFLQQLIDLSERRRDVVIPFCPENCGEAEEKRDDRSAVIYKFKKY